MRLGSIPGMLRSLCAVAAFTMAAAAGAQQIAVTFDDLPAHGPLPPGETRLQVAQRVIHALHQAQVPPTYGFVNGIRIQEQADTIGVLGAWVAAGNPLGNHTWSHMNLNQNNLGAFQNDITHNEQLLQLQMKDGDWHWFRFPFLAEGDTPEKKMGVRAFLAQHGYKIAGVTMSFADYNWNEPYARCAAKGNKKEIGWLETSYLHAALDNVRFERQLSKELYGHDIPYVLLMHIGAFDGRMLPRLLDLYKREGFSFVSLEQAEQDPFYKYDVDPKLLPGPDSLEQAAAEKHLPFPHQEDFSKRLEAVCR